MQERGYYLLDLFEIIVFVYVSKILLRFVMFVEIC